MNASTRTSPESNRYLIKNMQAQTTDAGVPKSVVRHRRNSGLPLQIPGGQTGHMFSSNRHERVDHTPLPEGEGFSRGGHAISPAELRRIQEKFRHISPQEREILRKLGFKMEQALMRSRSARRSAPDGAGNQR